MGFLALGNSWVIIERRLEDIGKISSAGTRSRRRQEAERVEGNTAKQPLQAHGFAYHGQGGISAIWNIVSAH